MGAARQDAELKYRRGRVEALESLGHPDLRGAFRGLGLQLLEGGRPREASTALERSLALDQEALGRAFD